MTAVLRAEWTKLRNVRGTSWTVVLILALTVGFSLLLASGSSSTPPGAGGDNDIVRDSLIGVYLAQFPVVAFGVLTFTSEYATGLIHVTLAAMARRGRVLAAKALLVCVTVLVVGLAATATSFVASQRVLRENGYRPPGYAEWTLHNGAAQRAVLGSALLLVAIAVLALGVGAIFRHSAAAISWLLALLFVPLIFGPLLPERTGDLLQKATPGAGFAVQQTVARDDAIPIAPWAGLGVALAWAGGALFLAYILIRRRDA